MAPWVSVGEAVVDRRRVELWNRGWSPCSSPAVSGFCPTQNVLPPETIRGRALNTSKWWRFWDVVFGCLQPTPPPQICFSALAGARRKEQGQSRGGSHYSSESHLPWPPNCGHTLRLYSASQAQLYNIKLAYQQCLNNGWLQASRKYFCFFYYKKTSVSTCPDVHDARFSWLKRDV